MDICRPLLNQKHNMEWFLLRRFVDLVRIYFLLIGGRNHSNRVNIVLISVFPQICEGCCPLHNVYFNEMQINRWWNFKDKGHPFTLNLPMTTTKICRISRLRTVLLFLWINLYCSITDVVYCRNFMKFWYYCSEKYFLFFIRFFTKLFTIAVVLLLHKI